MIEVTGFSVERFMNMAAHKGIYMWNVAHVPGGVLMCVTIKGFKNLRDCAKKTKCRIKIRQKRGAPFIAHRYRKRKILVGGLLVSVGLIYFLSCFVWLIEIKGNSRISRDEIAAFCQEQGLQIGAFKYKIDKKKLKSEISNYFHDISWLDVSIKGTKATIELVETIPKPVMIDKSEPCDIVAVKDGLITSIITGAGRPLVKQNDVVKKGDVLVSGVVIAAGDSGDVMKAVHAYSEVWAKMYNEINLDIPYQYEEKEYTGRSAKRLALIIFGKSFAIPGKSIEYESYDKSARRTQLTFGEDYPLPIILVTDTYREFKTVSLTRTLKEAEELAEATVNARIIREFDFAADIIDKSVALEEAADALKVKALITTNQRIDKEQPISADAAAVLEERPEA
jgi:similar to stage IV sporulation protein